jgi:hypothetical protein
MDASRPKCDENENEKIFFLLSTKIIKGDKICWNTADPRHAFYPCRGGGGKVLHDDCWADNLEGEYRCAPAGLFNPPSTPEEDRRGGCRGAGEQASGG